MKASIANTLTTTVLALTGCPEIPFPYALHEPTRIHLEQRTAGTNTLTTIAVTSWSAAAVLTFSDDRAALREGRADPFEDIPSFLHKLILEATGVDAHNLVRAAR